MNSGQLAIDKSWTQVASTNHVNLVEILRLANLFLLRHISLSHHTTFLITYEHAHAGNKQRIHILYQRGSCTRKFPKEYIRSLNPIAYFS